jgi:predicted lipoprotein with Yx(FWY)xxD motif
MRNAYTVSALTTFVLCFTAGQSASARDQAANLTEAYVQESMPPGFKVFVSPVEGPIYTDVDGRTLYKWPRHEMRNGGTADMKGSASACDNVKVTENAGMMSPYPGGLALPELDTRPTCAHAWPPVLAAADAKPIGKWSIIERHDHMKQWAYDGQVLYTSSLDKAPGATVGGSHTQAGGGDTPAYRIPISPSSDIPGQFIVRQNNLGRQVRTANGSTVYAFDGDGPNKSNCTDVCAKMWQPVLAPEVGSLARKDWSVVQREGVRQWTYRKKPLYTYVDDEAAGAEDGLDVPGWHAVFTQPAPAWPKSFTTQITTSGIVLADSKGHTIYEYNCGDDSVDQLACDHPDTPQEYRYAVCGGGDPSKCAHNFPYVIATKADGVENAAWTIMDIDPSTGRRAKPGQADAVHVWAYRERPVYTFVRDVPGTLKAHTWGEFYGQRNGYKAVFIREEFQTR